MGDKNMMGVVYSITAVICMLQIALIINRTRATKYKETIDEQFCQMLYFFCAFCFVDMLWGIFDTQHPIVTQWGFTIIAYGYHTMSALSAFIWFRYMLYYTNVTGKDRKILNRIRVMLLLVQLILISSNIFTHEAFYVDDDCNYHMGNMRIYMYCLQFSYYVILMGYSGFKLQKDRENRRSYLTEIIFSFVPLLCGILQYIIYDAAMYSLGFMFSAFIIYSYSVTSQREKFMEERYHSLDRRQSSIIQGLAGDFSAIYYIDPETGFFDTYIKSENGEGLVKKPKTNENYFELVKANSKKYVYEEDQKIIDELINKRLLEKKLDNKNSYELVVRVLYQGEIKYFKYRYVRPNTIGEEDKLIVGVYDIDELVKMEMKKQAEIKLAHEKEILYRDRASKMSKDANTDEPTGLPNRRAYENALKMYQKTVLTDDLVYVSLDLNCLKMTNDNLGHEAGDELIKGAADCMKECFGEYGDIYRIGGDEFAALLYIEKDKISQVFERFEETTKKWSGELVKELSVSYGYILTSDCQELTIYQISKLADKKMYQHKSHFYLSKGIDRRGQQAAYDAVCRSYTKILRVDLSQDLFSVIQMSEEEKKEQFGYQEKISEWLREFALKGNVFEDDKEQFLEKTRIDYLRDYFKKGNQEFCLHYRRLIGGKYKRCMLQMIPVKEYSDSEQIVFLYVKKIDK